jgi:hypothetical protein
MLQFALPQFARRRQHLQHQGDKEPSAARQLQPDTMTDQTSAVKATRTDQSEHPAGISHSESAQIDAENRARLAAMALDEVMLLATVPSRYAPEFSRTWPLS